MSLVMFRRRISSILSKELWSGCGYGGWVGGKSKMREVVSGDDGIDD